MSSECQIKPAFSLLKEVEERSGENISRCYQCRKCSGGCPLGFAMDYYPNVVNRLVQLGAREQLLQSKSIWLCIGCKTCKARCPNKINTGHVMDTLKSMALEARAQLGETNVDNFNQSFLSSVENNGRLHELGVMMKYKMKTGTYMQDSNLGMEMMKRRKLNILPHKVRNIKEIREIFRKAKEKR